jgi:hypothetical protein
MPQHQFISAKNIGGVQHTKKKIEDAIGNNPRCYGPLLQQVEKAPN